MSFQNDYDKLLPDDQKRVDQWCVAFSSIVDEGKGAIQNLRIEETLDDDSFDDLFSQMNSADTPENLINTFEEFCRQYELCGREADIPDGALLIRAIDTDAFALSVAESTRLSINVEEYIDKPAERMRIKNEIYLSKRYRTKSDGTRYENKVCWATFLNHGEQEFSDRGWDAAGIFDALGKPWKDIALGCFLFEYPYEKLDPDMPRVPTIADAGINANFLPANPGALFGRTRPVTPADYPSLNEVVHKNRLADIATSVEYVARKE